MSSFSFLFGAATSAHQVEGNNIHNDWWAYEQSHPDFPKSGRACDHWNTWREDIALAKSLGHTAHRFSVEWSRIEPQEGKFNRQAIEHYKEVLLELRRQNIKSFVTLHHFTNPQWFALRGGWNSSDAVDTFVRYVQYVSQQLAGLVDYWITINEPNVYVSQSFLKGLWPPKEKSFMKTIRVARHLLAAHKKAYRVIHTFVPGAVVGLAQSVVGDIPEHVSQLDDRIVTFLFNYFYNHWFIKKSKGTHDFIGLNYYFSRTRRVTTVPPHTETLPAIHKVSDLGWDINPEGLTALLLAFKPYNRPIYITENGIADAVDSRRADYIRSHVKAVEAAQSHGVDVRGYLHWSLLDNFEWAEGFTPRFGLIEVDYVTQERRVRPSAYVYKAIIEQSLRKVHL